MKTKIVSVPILGLLFAALIACNPNDPKPEKATITEISGAVDTKQTLNYDSVYALLETDKAQTVVVGKSQLVDKKFKIALTVPPENALSPVESNFSGNVTISNPAAKSAGFFNLSLIKKNAPSSEILCGNTEILRVDETMHLSMRLLMFIYSDASVTISGKGTANQLGTVDMPIPEGDTVVDIDLNLLQGWNVAAMLATVTSDDKSPEGLKPKMELKSIPKIPADYAWKLDSEMIPKQPAP